MTEPIQRERTTFGKSATFMRILFLTQVLPYPLDAGPKVRAYYVLRYLAEIGHRVTLVSFVRETDTESALRHLQVFCDEVHTVPMVRSRIQDIRALAASLFGQRPFLIARDWVGDMAQSLRKLLSQGLPYDAVHADQLWMAPYALLARSAEDAGSPILSLDQHNAVFQIPKRLSEVERNPVKRVILNLEARKLARYETEVCQQFDHIVWVTEEDRTALRALTPKGEHFPEEKVVPICLEASRRRIVSRHQEARRVTFLGGLHWPPNSYGILWFLRKVWPQVNRSIPNALLTVIGKSPPAELMRHATGSATIDVTGYVENLEPYLEETAVFIIPLLAGGGMRVKILDAWNWGLPVVTTSIGAEGIQVKDESNVLVANTAQDFAHAVGRVFESPQLASRLIESGRRAIESKYNWRTTYRDWAEIYPCESFSSYRTLPA